MKSLYWIVTIVFLFIFGVGCTPSTTSESNNALVEAIETAIPTATATEEPATATPTPVPTNTEVPTVKPTATSTFTPLPTSTATSRPTKTATPQLDKLTLAADLVGFYFFEIPATYGDGYGIIQFNEDGTFRYGNEIEADTGDVDATSSGLWWFDAEVFYMVDETSNGWECDPDIEASYEIFIPSESQIEFRRVSDPCVEDKTFPSRWRHMDQIWQTGLPEN